jgi:23S rRNA pseudouridine955/2504/2580 synthase
MRAVGKIDAGLRSAEKSGEGGAQAPTRRDLPATAPNGARVAYVVVGADAAGQRLDNFLLRIARGVPKSHVYRIVRSGEVRVNRARAAVDQRLAEGDRLRIPPLRIAAPSTMVPAPPGVPPIVFEDEHLLVVDKPAGLAVHGGSGIAHGLIERIRAARSNQPFLELAHRIDRETSGLLLLAKTRRSLLGLHQQLRDGTVDKRYLALVAGDWQNDRQHVRLPLLKLTAAGGERRVVVDAEQGIDAHTVVTLRRRYGPWSLVQAALDTGRTHQIRVHLAHLGFPIAGDDRYGDFALNRALARGDYGVPFDRMFLHAHRVALAHPVAGNPLVFESALPPECGELIGVLERDR